MTTTNTALAARGDDTPAAVLSADCPWMHEDALGRRGASANYDTMSTDDLCSLTLPPRAERHVLFFWALANMPTDAARVLDAWGYVQLAAIDWIKLRPCGVCCATGRVDAFEIYGERLLVPGSDSPCPACRDVLAQAFVGMGTTVRNAHETCLICRPKNGRAPDRISKDVPSVFAAPMLVDIDGILGMTDEHGRPRRGLSAFVHSAKPERLYTEIIPSLYPGPRVEMFSRRSRAGWSTAHSNQDGKMDRVAEIMRDVWPARTREERLAKARRKAERR